VQGAEAWEVVKVSGRVRDMARYQQVAGAMVLAAVDNGEILLIDVSNHSGQILLRKPFFHPGTHFSFTRIAPFTFCLPQNSPCDPTDLSLHQGLYLLTDHSAFEPRHLLTSATKVFPCGSNKYMVMLSQDQRGMSLIEVGDQEVWRTRMMYAPRAPNRVIRRVLELGNDREKVLLACDISDQPEKSEVIVFDTQRNLVLHSSVTDRVVEVATMDYSDEEEGKE
jgi:hypothetical protein